MLSDKALKEFKQIWKEQYGVEPTDAEATESAIKLLTLMNAVYRPIKKEWQDEYNQNNPEVKVLGEKVAHTEGVPPENKRVSFQNSHHRKVIFCGGFTSR